MGLIGWHPVGTLLGAAGRRWPLAGDYNLDLIYGRRDARPRPPSLEPQPG